MPNKRRFLAVSVVCALAAAFLQVSCTYNRREDIALPYAKKKCEETVGIDIRSDLRQSLSNFLWLCDSAYSIEADRWVEDEYASAQAYLETLHGGGRASEAAERAWESAPSLVWYGGNLRIDSVRENSFRPSSAGRLTHRVLSVLSPDTVMVHLYLIPDRFGSGRRPLALVPYDTLMRLYALPPRDFFEKGGILAVVGQCRVIFGNDSADNAAIAGSEPMTGSAPIADNAAIAEILSAPRHEYSAPRYEYPVLTRVQILAALNALVERGYTCPRRIALLSGGANVVESEKLFFERPGLFGAAYLIPPSDSMVSALLWRDFPALKDNTSYIGETSPYPALWLEPESSHYPLIAFLQEMNRRRCGAHPVLMYPTGGDYVTLWRFIRYHI